MIYLELLWSFIQIGLFSIGGGYAAMPLIQHQAVEVHSWLTMQEFADIITISEMTPGPITINSATFVGIQVAGVTGALAATLGCILPSSIIVTLLAFIYYRFKGLEAVQSVLKGLRPAIIALIASAGISLFKTAILIKENGGIEPFALILFIIAFIIASLALMLIYVAVRFELMSGVVALICLVHDMIMMVLFMCIFHIELASTFIAALITILGYSINNTIIIFDMIRDLNKRGTCGTPTEIANISVRDTLVRSINTTATTFITVAMIAIMSAIFSVWDLLTFCLPLMAGLIAGMFSSVLLAPTMWALIKTRQLKKAATKKPTAEAVSAAPTPFKDSALENFFAGGDAEAVKAPADGEAQPSGEAGDAAGSADSAAGEAKPEEGAQEAESEVTSESADPSASAADEAKPDDATSDDKE